MKNSRRAVARRQEKILLLLTKTPNLDVNGVAEQLQISTATVRRDFAELARAGLVTRFHGGARLRRRPLLAEDAPADEHPKSGIDREQKETIAKYAAGLINDGDTIFMNSSSTTLLLLDYLKDKHVVIVTNNGSAVSRPHDDKVTLLMTGGEVYTRRRSLVGEFALESLMRIRADKCFLGVSGISASGGLTTSVLQETAVNATMMRRASTCYILAANTKIGHEHNFRSADLERVKGLITCKGGDASALDALRAKGIEIVELDVNLGM